MAGEFARLNFEHKPMLEVYGCLVVRGYQLKKRKREGERVA